VQHYFRLYKTSERLPMSSMFGTSSIVKKLIKSIRVCLKAGDTFQLHGYYGPDF